MNDDEIVKVIRTLVLKSIKEEIGTNEWIMEHDRLIRNKAIDDFANACKSNTLCQTFGLRQCDIEELAEQLKKGELV